MEKPHKYVVVDLETTGKFAHRNSITEIGAIMVDPDKDERISFQRLIWREKPIDPEVVEMTGITVALLKSKGIPLKDAMDEFLAFIGDTPIVAYNANFDRGFLMAAAMKCGLEINNEFICALELARQAWIGLPNYKLETVSRHLQLDMTDQHRSLSDCRRTIDVFEAGHAILEEREREKAAKAAMRARRKPRPAQIKEEIAAAPEPVFIREAVPQKEAEAEPIAPNAAMAKEEIPEAPVEFPKPEEPNSSGFRFIWVIVLIFLVVLALLAAMFFGSASTSQRVSNPTKISSVAKSENASTPWNLDGEVNKVTGVKTEWATDEYYPSDASSDDNSYGLVVRKTGNKIQVYITTPDFFETVDNVDTGLSPVQYKFDHGRVKSMNWDLGEDNTTLFYPGNPKRFLQQLAKSSYLYFQYSPADKTPQVQTIYVAGFPKDF